MISIHIKRNLLKINLSFTSIRNLKKKTKLSTERALDYFDKSYPQIYGKQWKSIKKSLLSEKKYVAVLNNFSDSDNIKKQLEDLSAFNLGQFYNNKVTKKIERIETRASNELDFQEVTFSTNEKRPSQIEWTDNELAEKANREIARYPDQFKVVNTSNAYLDSDENRIIKPSEAEISSTANIGNFIPPTKLKGLEDWVEETDAFIDARESDEDIGVQREKQAKPIKWPEMLNVYLFVPGDHNSEFPTPSNCPNCQVATHFLMDGASILPVLALDIQPGEKVLDLCAAPGGKSFLMWQSLMPSLVLSNDLKKSRVERIHNIIEQYIPHGLTEVRSRIAVTNEDGRLPNFPNSFDKVLVDVPCNTDRHSVNVDENNIFTNSRLMERLKLPEIQAELLFNGIKSARPGGSIVYSSCTLSPMQNDGVVNLALNKIWNETDIECKVIDLSHTVKHLKLIFQFGKKVGLRYGHLCIPNYLRNFGPMYFSKIVRIK